MATPLAFAAAVLDRLGLSRTENRLVGLVAFVAIEGGHWHDSARFNPLNTMKSAPGATQAPGLLTGIKSYPDWQTGINATAATIVQSNMHSIAQALKDDVDPRSFLRAVTQSAWCPGCDYTPFDPYALYKAKANENDSSALAYSASGTNWKTVAVVGGIFAGAGAAVWWVKKRFLR